MQQPRTFEGGETNDTHQTFTRPDTYLPSHENARAEQPLVEGLRDVGSAMGVRGTLQLWPAVVVRREREGWGRAARLAVLGVESRYRSWRQQGCDLFRWSHLLLACCLSNSCSKLTQPTS